MISKKDLETIWSNPVLSEQLEQLRLCYNTRRENEATMARYQKAMREFRNRVELAK